MTRNYIPDMTQRFPEGLYGVDMWNPKQESEECYPRDDNYYTEADEAEDMKNCPEEYKSTPSHQKDVISIKKIEVDNLNEDE
jgi:hypothetical protein